MSTTSAALASDCCSTAVASPADSKTWWRIAIGAFLAFNSMTIALTVNLSAVDHDERLLLQGIPLCVCLIVGVLLGGPVISASWRQWRDRRLTVESLFLLSIVGAFSASLMSFITGEGPVFFEVVSILLVVYALGKELGRYGQEKVLLALNEWSPSALLCEVVEATGMSRKIPVAEIRPGDWVRVHPGAMIPVDGLVREGQAFVHEASMSGEGFGTPRRSGDPVLAGTHVVDATLVVEAGSEGTGRCIDRISAALREAVLQPGESQVTANRIMQWFVPVVTVTALLTFFAHFFFHGWREGLFDAMAVLLVACPCALGFATPVAVWTAMRRLNALGLFVRSGRAIENLARVNCAAFDKTGTLTLPDAIPELQLEPVWLDHRTLVEELISAAESGVEHPIAKILQPLARAGNFLARSVRIEPGLGISAEVDSTEGAMYHVRIVRAADLLDDGHHRLSVEIDGQTVGSILLRETQRPLVTKMIEELRGSRIESLLVTGDSAVRAVKLPLTEVFSHVTPEEKLSIVRRKRQAGAVVLFVGDGINDAAAMAESDVSIAVGSESLTREVADIDWPVPDLSLLPKAIALSRQTCRVIHSNLVFALCYNIIGMAIAAAGFLHPVIAALLMTTSSCVVTFRSIQLLESD